VFFALLHCIFSFQNTYLLISNLVVVYILFLLTLALLAGLQNFTEFIVIKFCFLHLQQGTG